MGFYTPILYPVPLRRGGLGADVSAYNGIVYIANGAAGQVTPGIGVDFDPNTGVLTGQTRIQRNGSTVGERPIVNLIEGQGIALNVQDDSTNNRINVEISSTCCGGSQTDTGQLLRPIVAPSPVPDGSNPIFVLPDTPEAGSEHVYVNGYLQLPTTDYTLAGNAITFNAPIPAGPPDPDSILTDYWSGTPAQSALRRVLETPTGLIDGVNTVYTTAADIYTNTERIWKGPLLLRQGTDYTVTDTNEFTLTVAPIAGDTLRITYFEDDGSTVPTNSVFRDSYAGAIDGTNDTLTLTQTPIPTTVHVYRNGQLDTPGLNYDVVADTVVFQVGYIPLTGDDIEIFFDTSIGFSQTILNNRVMYETPAGAVDGVNDVFTVAQDVMLGFSEFYVEGEQLHWPDEYTQGGAGNRTFTLAVAPLTGNRVWVNSWRA